LSKSFLRFIRRCRLLPLLIGSLLLSLEPAALRADVRDVRRDAAVEAIERVLPSVVNVETKSRGERRLFYDWWRENWGPFFQEMPPQYSAGSGVIIHEDGYVLTNVHVVEQADEIWVKLSDGSRVPARRLVGVRKTDVALLKLLGKPGKMRMDGKEVYPKYLEGKLAEINDYCLHDVLDTYFIFLRTRVMTGELTLADEHRVVLRAKEFVRSRVDQFPGLQLYLDHWGDWKPWP
jgi:hypothetical protein